jgi:hypothetical protein
MGACHPDDLPEGYHTAARGQSPARSGAVCVEGCPRASARSGCARSTGWHLERSRGALRRARPCNETCDARASHPGSGAEPCARPATPLEVEPDDGERPGERDADRDANPGPPGRSAATEEPGAILSMLVGTPWVLVRSPYTRAVAGSNPAAPTTLTSGFSSCMIAHRRSGCRRRAAQRRSARVRLRRRGPADGQAAQPGRGDPAGAEGLRSRRREGRAVAIGWGRTRCRSSTRRRRRCPIRNRRHRRRPRGLPRLHGGPGLGHAGLADDDDRVRARVSCVR